MKILIHSPIFFPHIGGSGVINDLIAKEFVKAGLEVVLLTPIECESNLDTTYKIIRSNSNKVLWKYFKWCDYYIQSPISVTKIWPVLINKRKSVLIHHSCTYNWYQKDDFRSLIKKIVSSFSRNIVVSNVVGEKLGIKSYKVINNAYNNTTFKLTNTEDRDGFVYVGRLSAEKGVGFLIKAYSKYIKVSKKKSSLTIIGTGYESEDLRKMVSDFELTSNIFFIGNKIGEDLSNILNNKSCLIIPSICYEAFGIVALEGMACGCKILGTDGDGVQEAVGSNGVLFKKNNIESLVEKMLEIDNTENFNKDYYNKTIKPYLSKFSPENIVKQYIDYLNLNK